MDHVGLDKVFHYVEEATDHALLASFHLTGGKPLRVWSPTQVEGR